MENHERPAGTLKNPDIPLNEYGFGWSWYLPNTLGLWWNINI